MAAADRETDLGLRERKKLRTRAILIDAALELCLRHGYEQTTVDQIAAVAEVAPRTYSRYFASKEAVFLTLLEDLSHEIAAEVALLPRGIGPIEALRAAHIAVLTKSAAGQVGGFTSDRAVLTLRVINSADALRQSAFQFRSPAVLAALAELMGVEKDDRQLLLGLSVFSAIIIAACGDLVEDVDGIPLGPLLMIERLNQACEQVAGFAGQIFATSPGQQAAVDDIPANA
ncbi:MAG: helix-turn-helix domain-containing protein [Mycobacterium sp.]|nr:helix-turn-helix domain-containing protein [Mycobacterium sp.]